MKSGLIKYFSSSGVSGLKLGKIVEAVSCVLKNELVGTLYVMSYSCKSLVAS